MYSDHHFGGFFERCNPFNNFDNSAGIDLSKGDLLVGLDRHEPYFARTFSVFIDNSDEDLSRYTLFNSCCAMQNYHDEMIRSGLSVDNLLCRVSIRGDIDVFVEENIPYFTLRNPSKDIAYVYGGLICNLESELFSDNNVIADFLMVGLRDYLDLKLVERN